MPVLPEDSGDLGHARTAVREYVEKVANEIGETVPKVTVNLVTEDPAEELINASRDADMLVVGSRSSGGFAKLLLGSVSSKVTHHAARAVVVIPETR
jgi:nucleotide-binding universal stress UspA family protein